MNEVEITSGGIQQAAAAGVKLLSDPELKVPLGLVNDLTVLKILLSNIHTGSVQVMETKEENQIGENNDSEATGGS